MKENIMTRTASKTSATIDYKALAPKYEGMFLNLDRAQWEIGKALYEDGLVSDGNFQRLAELIGRETKTLKTYHQVYVNFRDRFPAGRPENVSHGVLEQLNRIADEDAQNEFLGRYTKPTRTQAEQFVNTKLAEKTGRRTRRSVDTTSLKVGDVIFRISVTDNGVGTLSMEGAKLVGTARKSEVSENWTLEFSA
jgi:hypothetical protein